MREISILVQRSISINLYSVPSHPFLAEKILKIITSRELFSLKRDFVLTKKIKNISFLFDGMKEEERELTINLEETKNFYNNLFFFFDEVYSSNKKWKKEKYLKYKNFYFCSSSKLEAEFLMFLIELSFSNKISEILIYVFDILVSSDPQLSFFHSVIPEFFGCLIQNNEVISLNDKKEDGEKYFSRDEIFNMVRRHLSLL